jgi:hypothetical protein
MKKNNFLKNFSIFLIKELWQKRFGPRYKKKRNIVCRFYPDCSNYAIQSLTKYGFILGWKKAINRLKRCTNKNTESCIDFP